MPHDPVSLCDDPACEWGCPEMRAHEQRTFGDRGHHGTSDVPILGEDDPYTGPAPAATYGGTGERWRPGTPERPYTIAEAWCAARGAAWALIADVLESLPQRWAIAQDAVDWAWRRAGAEWTRADDLAAAHEGQVTG